MPLKCVLTTLAILFSLNSLAFAQEDPFRAIIRPTDPLSPQDELKTFTVPEGFEVQLFASEPDLLKPMNLAFDAKGRLWVSMSQEYPYAAPLDKTGRDVIKILEDTDGDGTADKFTTFADGLNIPIGLYPYKNGVIAWSIPNIWYLEDTDGDDKADKRTILYGPMGFERDTHGMNNGFTRGYDGWLYACHGFNNQTTVKGADGHEISMQSGNTYRMRLHGERIEHFTWGQVNPFGMTIDEYGNLFTADCHSKPIYQLVHAGYYPSFGKPHDGLGFVPQMMEHSHGSTAIGGVAIVSGVGFPEEFRGDAYTGNVMTSRVNRDRLDRFGASVKAVEQPDFLISTDPWFRPVNIQYGPDDALYVADFYNKIIGHYEVPLDDPRRDRTSGRIWRIVYTGEDATGSAKRLPDLSVLSVDELIGQLSSSNLAKRMLITDRLSDVVGKQAIAPCRKALRLSDSATARVHCLWVLHRLHALQPEEILLLSHDRDPFVRSHLYRAVAEFPAWLREFEPLVQSGLSDEHAEVQIAAAEMTGMHPREQNLHWILRAYKKSNPQDVILRHALMIALKRHLLDPHIMQAQNPEPRSDEQVLLIAKASLAVPTAEAGEYLLRALEVLPPDALDRSTVLEHVAANISAAQVDQAIARIREQAHDQVDLQYSYLQSMEQGFARRNKQRPSQLAAWAASLVPAILDSIDSADSNWHNLPLSSAPTDDPWDRNERKCADGKTAALLSSFPHGERLTGVLRSPVFSAPARFRFYGCGHRGFPDTPAHDKNEFRIRDAESGEILKADYPPRNDTARLYDWDLSDFSGHQVVFEIVDGDAGRAYAWLAAGRFEPAVIKEPEVLPRTIEHRLTSVAGLIGRYRLKEFTEFATARLKDPVTSGAVKAGFAEALLQLTPDDRLNALAPLLGEPELSSELAARIVSAVTDRETPVEQKLFDDTFATIPGRLQVPLAQRLTSSKLGAELLIDLCERGKASARLLQVQSILQSLKATGGADWEARVAKLTERLPSMKAELRELISSRLQSFSTADSSFERGKLIFEKNCKNCHRIGDQGELVGPQLDGIGNRGLERLLEDVLDPNQNVDVAFHTMTVIRTDGKVLTGLFRRAENGNWVLADNKGKEFLVAESDIEESAKSPLSLMPENIARDLKAEEFYDLIRFLLEQTSKTAPSLE